MRNEAPTIWNTVAFVVVLAIIVVPWLVGLAVIIDWIL